MPITVSVPGKLMLMGEHAVVYGRPCLVTAVDQRMKVSVELLDDLIFKLEAPDLKIDKYQKSISDLGKGEIIQEAKFVEQAVYIFLNEFELTKGVSITTASEFSANYGLGSSSAVTVGVIKALAELLQIKISPKELFDLACKTVLDVQQKGSGFDVASAIYGGTIYFKDRGQMIESLSIDELNIVVGYSGVKVDTASMVNLVNDKMKNYHLGMEKIFDNIARLVDEARKAILEKDFERLGTLMDYNQNYLEDLGVSTDKLNQMIEAAKKDGAYGAKLSGAGGGDCMIALVSPQNKEKIKKTIKEVGGEIIEAAANAEGVKVEVS